MRQKIYRQLRAIVFSAAVLHLVACGSSRTSTSTPPAGSPVTAGANAASGPLLGAWWDANHKSLRTVYGVAGAAHQGTPTFSDGSYSGAATCMRKNIALLTTPSGSIYSVALPHGEPVAVSSMAISKASIAFSPSCTSSLVYTLGSTAAVLVQGLLSTPVGTPMILPAGGSAAAIADSGAILIAAPGSNGATSIRFLASGTSSFQPVTVLAKYGGMAFLPGADTAVLADASANTIVEASHLGGSVSLTSLATEADGVGSPASVAVSADGRLAAIANNNGASVLRLDLSRQSPPIKTVCHCWPTELEPLAGNFIFRVNEPGSGTVWAFDGDSLQPRMFFIPTDQVASTQRGGSR